MTGTIRARLLPLATVREFSWSHPEWPCVVGVAVAWSLLAHRHLGAGHAHHHHHGGGFAAELGAWMLMVAAMMLPLILESVRTAAFRSLRARRQRAVTVFLAGYFACWLAVGLPVAWLLDRTGARPDWAAAAFALAALWVLLPQRRRALTACHRTVPLAPVGWRADRTCLHFGATVGRACVAACAPLMLACALSGHGAVAMVGGAAIGAIERRSFRSAERPVFAATLALAAFYLSAAR